MDKNLAWTLTAKGRVTQVLVFSGKVAGRSTADTGLQAKARAWRDWARVASRQLAAPGYIPGQRTKLDL